MTSEYQLMIAGKLHSIHDETLNRIRNKTRDLIYDYNQSRPTDRKQRAAILAQLVDNPSHDAYIELPTRMDYGVNLHIGKHFYANYDSIFLDIAPITIGDHVMFGPRVSLYTAGHPIDAGIRSEALEFGEAITVGDHVWLGGNVVIGPGVRIGNDTIIGAGAVVVKDIPAHVIAVGNPARVLRRITQADRRYWQQQKAEYLKQRD